MSYGCDAIGVSQGGANEEEPILRKQVQNYVAHGMAGSFLLDTLDFLFLLFFIKNEEVLMTDMVKLIIKAGDEISKSFDLIKDKSVIGRDPNSDIVIEDIEVSKKHLAITRKGNTFQIEDQNSTNGTFLNGKKLKKPTAIKNGT